MSAFSGILDLANNLRRSSRRDQTLDDYYTQLRTDYERITPETITPQAREFFNEIRTLHEQDRLTWAKLFAFERAILSLLSPEDASARAWHIRDRYRGIVSKDQYALYESSHKEPATGAALQKEMDSLLLAISEYYVLRQGIELQRTEFSHRVQIMTGVLSTSSHSHTPP